MKNKAEEEKMKKKRKKSIEKITNPEISLKFSFTNNYKLDGVALLALDPLRWKFTTKQYQLI